MWLGSEPMSVPLRHLCSDTTSALSCWVATSYLWLFKFNELNYIKLQTQLFTLATFRVFESHV